MLHSIFFLTLYQFILPVFILYFMFTLVLSIAVHEYYIRYRYTSDIVIRCQLALLIEDNYPCYLY